MFYVYGMCIFCIVFVVNLCEIVNCPEVTLCGWLGYNSIKPSINKWINNTTLKKFKLVLTLDCVEVKEEWQGNVYSGAMPPWLLQEGADGGKEIGPTADTFTKHRKHKVFTPHFLSFRVVCVCVCVTFSLALLLLTLNLYFSCMCIVLLSLGYINMYSVSAQGIVGRVINARYYYYYFPPYSYILLYLKRNCFVLFCFESLQTQGFNMAWPFYLYSSCSKRYIIFYVFGALFFCAMNWKIATYIYFIQTKIYNTKHIYKKFPDVYEPLASKLCFLVPSYQTVCKHVTDVCWQCL